MRLTTACLNERLRKKLMNPVPAISAFSRQGEAGNAAISFAAMSRGDCLSALASCNAFQCEREQPGKMHFGVSGQSLNHRGDGLFSRVSMAGWSGDNGEKKKK